MTTNIDYLVRRGFLVTITVALSLGIGCASKKTDDSLSSAGAFAGTEVLASSDAGNAMGLQTVHFEYDSFSLTSRAQSTLRNNLDILRNTPRIRVQIEGHCDERGSIQYNIALGEKRAESVKRYLVSNGISADRLTTISYGEEKPLDPSSNEAAWARNRRANFGITAQ